MANAGSNNTIQVARRWIDTLNDKGQWRVEVLARRYRKSSPGRRNPPLRIRRFAEGCPPAQMREAMEYLLSLAPYAGVVLNGEVLPGTYRPTLTEWRRDRGDVIHRARTDLADSTYTLVQDLVDADAPDGLPAGTLSTCSREETTEWTWDAGSIDEIPAPEQGVVWSIQGVRRNDDGTFDYALVKRVAVTQHLSETPVEDGAFETSTVETWDNLYGDPDSGFRDHTGAEVDVPQASATVKLEVQENEDCTYRVRIVRTEGKHRRASQSSRHTIYEGEHTAVERGAAAPMALAPAPSSGVVRRHKSELQQDGTFMLDEDVTVERPVVDAEVVTAVGRRGTRVERVHRNQSAPAPTDAIEVGGSVKTEKTPGGLYTNTIRTWSAAARRKVAEACAKTLFKHVDSSTVSGVSSIPSSHVTRSAGNTVRRTTEMDDEGAITQTTETTAEVYVPRHVESWTVGLTGVVHTVRHASAVSALGSLSYSRANIGRSVKNTRTEADRYDTETTEVIRSGTKVGTGVSCKATVFEHEHETATADPAGSMATGHVSAGGGKTRRISSQLREDGTSVTTDAVVTELPSKGAEVSYRRTAKMIVHTVKNRNVSQTIVPPASPGGAVEYRRTPGGLADVTTTDVSITAQPDRAAASATIFERSQTTQTTKVGVPTVPAVSAGGGHYQDADSRTDDYGICSTDTRTVDELSVPGAQVVKERRLHVAFTTTQNRNSPAGSAPGEPRDPGTRSSSAKTPGGSVNLEECVRTVVDTRPDHYQSMQDAFERHDSVQTITDGAQTGVQPSPAPAPGNGVWKTVERRRDTDGMVAETVTTVTEKNVPAYRREVAVTHFTKSSTTEDKAGRDSGIHNDEFVEEDGGVLHTTTVTGTRGGQYDRADRTVTAVGRVWDDPVVDMDRLYKASRHFRNLKKAAAEREINDLVNRFRTKLDNWFNRGNGWSGPTSYDVSPRMTLNDFGLYDGEVTVLAKWQNESAGQNGDENHTYLDMSFKTVTISETWSHPPGASKIHVQRASLKRHHRLIVGRGGTKLLNLMHNNEYFEGTSVNFVPSTATFTAHLIYEIDQSDIKEYDKAPGS